MSLADKSGHDDQLVRYLLGLLPSEEAERLDEASIVDDEMSARLRGVEDDLVDAYLRGTLAGEMRTRFESHYLSSPRRREQVAMAGRFVRAVDRAAAAPAAAGAGRGSSGSRLVSTLAVAATLSIVAGGALLLQTVRMGRGLTAVQKERAALDRHAQQLEREVSELRGTNAAVTRELERVRESPPPAVREPTAIALVLLPQTRSIGPVPTLAIPSGSAGLAFELRLESNDYPVYQVGLKDPAVNAIVWRSGWTAAKSPAGKPAVRVTVPSSLLKPQHYALDLSGRKPRDAAEVVGSYAFEIVP